MSSQESFPICDPKPWIELSILLHEAQRALPYSPVAFSLKTPPRIHPAKAQAALRDQARALTAAHGPEAIRGVAQWSQSREWPTMTPESVFFANKMLEMASTFVLNLTIGDPGKERTIFPFPNALIEDVFVWLMTEWWSENGAEQWAWAEASTPRHQSSDS